ncbi:hypothetical protein I302_101898 [Kwoniella bestiolae CBS 10118]|uniref:Restriction of telomere capping protein 4 n=1 Tax=Kwoniella bestiolae CBS 10118 TaxID=1296100 RepID=A0A1B9GDI0_9TREE|nr:hypothetical protein I302_00579 [Kwoniella bestiolae CBS 10118]OCF29087.1 hypothetical protein I302_00579 [Kwoniella bestiolae CBS 10118]
MDMFGMDLTKPSRVSVSKPKARPTATSTSTSKSKTKPTTSSSSTVKSNAKASSSTTTTKEIKRTGSNSNNPTAFFQGLQQSSRDLDRTFDKMEYVNSKNKDKDKDTDKVINGKGSSSTSTIKNGEKKKDKSKVRDTPARGRGTRILSREESVSLSAHSGSEDEMSLGNTPPANMHRGYDDYRSGSQTGSSSPIKGSPSPIKKKKKVLVPDSEDEDGTPNGKLKGKKRSSEDEIDKKNKKKRRTNEEIPRPKGRKVVDDDTSEEETDEEERKRRKAERKKRKEEEKERKRDSLGGTAFFAHLSKLRRDGDYQEEQTEEHIDISKMLEEVAEEDEELTEEERKYLVPFRSKTELCPYCYGPFPSNPSPNLLRQQEELHALSTPKPTESNPNARELSWQRHIEFCGLHHAETSVIPLGIRAGYPESIDFANLNKRLEDGEIRYRLDEIVLNPSTSEVFRRVIREIEEVGKDVWGGIKWQSKPENLEAVKPGYYGDLGRIILIDHFLSMRKWGYYPWLTKSLNPPTIDPLSWTEFVTHVLVPEASILLIMDDQKSPTEYVEAERIRKESVNYGMWKFREDDEDSKGILSELMEGKEDKKGRLKKIRKERARREKYETIEGDEEGAMNMVTPKAKMRVRKDSVIEIGDSPGATPIKPKREFKSGRDGLSRFSSQSTTISTTERIDGEGGNPQLPQSSQSQSASMDYDGDWDQEHDREAAELVP